ncbi:hypothetical protein HN388_00515 [bacterium]|jgi:hypothetical protein|nr:hypothetical protein [bacterium]
MSEKQKAKVGVFKHLTVIGHVEEGTVRGSIFSGPLCARFFLPFSRNISGGRKLSKKRKDSE